MFYFNEGWKPYDKKVTYTIRVIEYENDTTRFPADAVITDNVLTNEEMERLEVIRNTDMTLKDVIAYVKTGVPQGQAIELDKVEQSRKAILASLDTATVAPEMLIQSGLSRVWAPDSFMPVGELVDDKGKLYKVLQSHMAQVDWEPENSPSLFAPLLTDPAGAVLPWVQPDSTNPYMTGDKVTFNGKTYESTINNNVWSITAYPAGWREII